MNSKNFINSHFIDNFLEICYRKQSDTAFISGSDSITYGELHNTAQNISSSINSDNAPEGALVFIFSHQNIELISVFLGVIYSGLVPALMPLPSYKQDELRYWKSHSELFDLERPCIIIAPDEYIGDMRTIFGEQYNIQPIEKFRSPLKEITTNIYSDKFKKNDANRPLFAQHSSGTTGLKKCVVLNSLVVNKQVEAYSSAIALTSKDVIVSWLPMYHDMGFIACTIMPLLRGVKVILIDPFNWVSKPYILFQEIDSHSGTLVWMPNFAFHFMQKAIGHKKLNFNLSSVRAFINCSEPCKRSSFRIFFDAFEKFNLKKSSLHCCYAMAETVFAITQTDLDRSLLSNELESSLNIEVDSYVHEYLPCGREIPGIDLLIVNSQGENLPDGAIGEITIKSDFLFSGYYNRPDLTAEKIINGRYYTGDLGFIFNRELFVVGRVDDLIISHGKKIIAHEVESYLNTIDFIKPGRVLLIPLYNDDLDTNDLGVIAEVVFDTVTDSQILDIKNLVNSDLGVDLSSVFIVPSGWLIKSTSGKISRKANLEKFLIEKGLFHE